MLRQKSSLLAIAIAVTAALPGAPVFAQTPPAAAGCLEVRLDALSASVLASDLVVIGVVHEEHGGGLARIEPQAYLKGAASNEAIHLVPTRRQLASSCELARLTEGTRLMAFLHTANGGPAWPGANEVFWLADGRASGSGGNTTESDLVEKVRAITHQYAVPAASQSEGAGIDWGKTVVPLSIALLIVFGIGLVLMRVWHRIDPT